MKKKVEEKITSFEWDLLWMALRYAMNRQTISCSMLPGDIIKNYYHKLTADHKKSIVRDLRQNLKEHGENAFGHPNIDRPTWLKFLYALDTDTHYKVNLIDDTECVVFDLDDKIIPLHMYIDFPHNNHFVPEENIKR